jgi:Holliday junction resolvase RusA-like endonuclease
VITIEVRGLPAPQGSKRHVGRGIMVESSKAVGPWREAVRAETQRTMKALAVPGTPGGVPGPLAGPLVVLAEFHLPRPKSHYRTGRNADRLRDSAPAFPFGQPDVDKLARAVLDGLTAGGAWIDDAQVVSLGARKTYGLPPGCRIEIEQLEEL